MKTEGGREKVEGGGLSTKYGVRSAKQANVDGQCIFALYSVLCTPYSVLPAPSPSPFPLPPSPFVGTLPCLPSA